MKKLTIFWTPEQRKSLTDVLYEQVLQDCPQPRIFLNKTDRISWKFKVQPSSCADSSWQHNLQDTSRLSDIPRSLISPPRWQLISRLRVGGSYHLQKMRAELASSTWSRTRSVWPSLLKQSLRQPTNLTVFTLSQSPRTSKHAKSTSNKDWFSGNWTPWILHFLFVLCLALFPSLTRPCSWCLGLILLFPQTFPDPNYCPASKVFLLD